MNQLRATRLKKKYISHYLPIFTCIIPERRRKLLKQTNFALTVSLEAKVARCCTHPSGWLEAALTVSTLAKVCNCCCNCAFGCLDFSVQQRMKPKRVLRMASGCWSKVPVCYIWFKKIIAKFDFSSTFRIYPALKYLEYSDTVTNW